MGATTKRNDGGPAYPTHVQTTSVDGQEFSYTMQGMTLRDWFAGQALAGFIATFAHPQAINPPEPENAAGWAYQYADAMIAAREQEASQ